MSLLDAFRGQDSPLSRLLAPEVALPMAAALMGNGGNMQNIGNAFAAAGTAFKASKNKNRTLEFLRTKAPEYAQAIEAGLPLDDAWKAYLSDQKELKAQTSKATQYGLNPIWGTDENGKPVLGAMGTDGSFKKVDTGGVNLDAGVDKVDLGTQWGLLNKRTGQIEGYMPKDIAGAAAQEEIGTSQGKAAAAAPADYQAGQNALDLADSLLTDPNRERGTGFSSLGNSIRGTSGYDFQTKVDQAKSGAFLTAIQQMRGLGSLSNAEGGAATAAVTRMNTATSEEEFVAAVNDYKAIVQQGMERAKQSAARGGVPIPQPSPPPGGRFKYNPATGELE